MPSTVRYCLDCGWRLRDTECESNQNPSICMVDHAVETSHDVATSRGTKGWEKTRC
jgi:C4-type Zn-finger protein